MSNNFFQFKQFKVLNPENGLKVTTDACLLGALAVLKNAQNILDIGAGSGVITLMLAQNHLNANIKAIEIDSDVSEIAIQNIQNSKFNNQIEWIQNDFLKHVFNSSFDLIVCNPPYYSNYLKSEDVFKNRYIHNTSLDFNELLKKISFILEDKGQFWCILPFFEMQNFEVLAQNHGLFPQSIIQVFNKPEKPFRKVVCFVQYHQQVKEKQLLLYHTNQQINEDFKQLMSDFYLD